MQIGRIALDGPSNIGPIIGAAARKPRTRRGLSSSREGRDAYDTSLRGPFIKNRKDRGSNGEHLILDRRALEPNLIPTNIVWQSLPRLPIDLGHFEPRF